MSLFLFNKTGSSTFFFKNVLAILGPTALKKKTPVDILVVIQWVFR